MIKRPDLELAQQASKLFGPWTPSPHGREARQLLANSTRRRRRFRDCPATGTARLGGADRTASSPLFSKKKNTPPFAERTTDPRGLGKRKRSIRAWGRRVDRIRREIWLDGRTAFPSTWIPLRPVLGVLTLYADRLAARARGEHRERKPLNYTRKGSLRQARVFSWRRGRTSYGPSTRPTHQRSSRDGELVFGVPEESAAPKRQIGTCFFVCWGDEVLLDRFGATIARECPELFSPLGPLSPFFHRLLRGTRSQAVWGTQTRGYLTPLPARTRRDPRDWSTRRSPVRCLTGDGVRQRDSAH